MKRTIIKIDEQRCNGCGICVQGCHEGALQLIDGKAVLVSELFCDGLGACIGDCPVDAITLEEREAEAYDEIAVMQSKESASGWGCSGAIAREIKRPAPVIAGVAAPEELANCSVANSELRQFPIQLHLLNPYAPFLKGADLLLAADCTAFANGEFHSRFLKGHKLAIACPKLDSNIQNYIDKLSVLIKEARLKSLTILIMEVPCCRGLIRIAEAARVQSIDISIRKIILAVDGKVKSEEWI